MGLVESTRILLWNKREWDALSFFLFFGTLMSYNLHRLVALQKPNKRRNVVIQWSQKNKRWVQTLFIISFLACGILYWFLSFKIQLILGVLGAITIFYSIPIIFNKKRFKLREITGLKIFLIAFVYTIATTLLPILQKNDPINSQAIFLMLERFFYLIVSTIPFDIRDAQYDQNEGIKTIPNLLGLKNTKKLAYSITIILMLITILNTQILQTKPLNLTITLTLFYLYITYLLTKASPKQNEYYCLFHLDGTMLLLLIILSSLRSLSLCG